MRRTISQREARRLRKQVEELEEREQQRLNTYGSGYPGIEVLMFDSLTEWSKGRLSMARSLGHVLVAKYTNDGKLYLYAVRKEAAR